MSRALLESDSSSVIKYILAGISVLAAVALWSAITANDKLAVARQHAERLELEKRGLVVAHGKTKAELKKLIDNPKTQTVVKTITKEVPGPVQVREVVKWRTKTETREVPVETIVEVFKFDPEMCPGLGDLTLEYDGWIYGEVVEVGTERDNVVIGGWANCYINDYEMVSEEFDWDATEAFALSGLALSGHPKRWWVGLDYALLANSETLSCDYPCSSPLRVDPQRFRLDGGRILFPKKKWSVGAGWFVDGRSTGPRVMLMR